MDYIKKYDNGLTLIVSTGGALSVSFGIMVKTGSKNENEKNNGISHYIEHICFKGTKNYNSLEISSKLDSLGASYNAYTSTDTTCFYGKVIKENINESFKIFSDMVLNSTFLDEETQKEKAVIIEEINMSEDLPDDVCGDLASLSFFGNDNYGRTVLGTEKNVLSFTKQDVLDYMSEFYVANNMVISFAGNITVNESEKLVEEYFLPFVKEGKKTISNKEIKTYNSYLSKNKDIEQVHFTLTFPSVNYFSPFREASEMACNILGGGMSSRLFVKIREELGLAYSVCSYNVRYEEVGALCIYAAVNKDKYKQAYKSIIEVIKDFSKNGVTKDEFEKARIRLLSSTIFSQETFLTKVQLFSKYYLFTGKLYDFDQRIKEIEKVTIEDINNLISTIDFNKMSTAIVGKNVKKLTL